MSNASPISRRRLLGPQKSTAGFANNPAGDLRLHAACEAASGASFHSAISSAGVGAVAVGAAGALVVSLFGASPLVAGACTGAADNGEGRDSAPAADAAAGFSAEAALGRGRGAGSRDCGFAVAWTEPGCVPGSTPNPVPVMNPAEGRTHG